MKYKLFFFCITLLFLINLVYSQVIVGNISGSIGNVYGTNQNLNGWINVSLINEPGNSLVNILGQTVSISDLVKNNDVTYSCFPSDCSASYVSNSEDVSKAFSLNSSNNKIIGIKLVGQVTGIDSVSFNLNTNVGRSCSNPLAIDLLDDNLTDWKSENITFDDFSCYGPDYYGCYNPADNSGVGQITTSPYCEKINIRAPSKVFEIGADVIKNTGGNVNFKMELNTGTISKICNVSLRDSGKVSCDVLLDKGLNQDLEADVCISVFNSSDNGKYQMNYETVNPCGYAGNQLFDFPIYAKGGKFEGINGLIFNQQAVDNNGINLASEIYNYVQTKYNSNCTPECLIPINIIAGAYQNITLSNLNLIYRVGVSKSESNFYDVNKNNSLISMDFKKLDLSHENFSVGDIGTKNVDIKIGNLEIFNQTIEVKSLPSLGSISPTSFPAFVPTTFSVSDQGVNGNVTYLWDFDDGSDIQTTNQNWVIHTYAAPGNYNIKVSILSSSSNVDQTFNVNALGSSKDYINQTIVNDINDLANINDQINLIDGWARTGILGILNLDQINSTLNQQRTIFFSGNLSNDQYNLIMKNLVKLKVPYTFNITQTIKPSQFVLSENQFDNEIIGKSGAGDVAGNTDLPLKINGWLLQNLDVSLESKTYSFFSRINPEIPFSYVKLTLIPKNKIDKLFLIINGNPGTILLNGLNGTNIDDKAVSVDISNESSIEFIYPGKINPIDLPIIILPELKEVGIVFTPQCNNNGVCDSGENRTNCANDCKTWGLTLTLLVILIFAAFVTYIVLQEWYKRHYESNLFQNKNQLFNIINFMNNSQNQGIKKGEIFSKLKDLGWSGEQINYAWKKLLGMRTGMWEIPIFKWIENKEVKNELQKRHGNSSVNMRQNIAGKRF